MARRSPRPRGARALGLGAVVVAAVLAGSLVDPVSSAQPAADLERAREFYQYAESAMQEGRFEDAVRDYGASYELSKDPALFFKIGRANERAGKCDLALIYYARYLHDGKPAEQFVATTRERMRACGGDVRNVPDAASIEPRPAGSEGGSATAPVEPRPPQGGPSPQGDSVPCCAADRNRSVRLGPRSGSGSGAPSEGSAGSAGSAAPPEAGSSGAGSGAGSGSAAEAGPRAPVLVPSNRHKIAWIMTGAAIALATLGGVLAYAASSSENDVRDLYVGFAGQPALFDAGTKKKYDDLVDQGRRFQHLSLASFGLGGAAAVGAAVLFVIGGRSEAAQHARVTPIVTPTGAGVSIGF